MAKKSVKREIWKLQRPLFVSSEEMVNLVLAYTKGKKKLAQIPVDDKTMKKIFGKEDKVYALCHPDKKTNMLVIDQFVEEQDW